MGNPFDISFNMNTTSGAGSVGYGYGVRGPQGTGVTGAPATRTPYENDMADFHNCIANWGGSPNYNMPGDPGLQLWG